MEKVLGRVGVKKKDGILAVVILAAAAVLYAAFHRSQSGSQVVIFLDGQEYGVYSLQQEQEIAVESKHGTNIVKIEDEMVYMKEADCPDRYCVKQGRTDNHNKSIICLPHKLVVEVREEWQGEQDMDAVAW